MGINPKLLYLHRWFYRTNLKENREVKIKFCDDYNTAVIEVSKGELGLIIGGSFGDRYGNHGRAFNNKDLCDKEFDLSKLRESQSKIKITHELKRDTIKKLKEMIELVDKGINFGVPELKGE